MDGDTELMLTPCTKHALCALSSNLEILMGGSTGGKEQPNEA